MDDPAVTAAAVHWLSTGDHVETAILSDDVLRPGNHIMGPAVLRLENTTVAVPPSDVCTVDERRNLVIEVTGE